jgi:NAD(P)-dependent dehydrogenase (short-subunit alcohol dehydrogenase family)
VRPAKHLCVMGGTSGIGLATAQRFVDEGGKVTVLGRDPTRLTAALAKLGPNAAGASIDAGDRTALDAFFAEVERIDYLVIAVSSGVASGPFRDLDVATLRRGFDNKFCSHFSVAQAALPAMTEAGSITFVAGATARFANPGTIGLAAVNGAVCQLVPTLARELVPLRVNAVAPGGIDTPWWNSRPVAQKQASAAQAPLKRLGRPEEVADAILCVARNPYITGVILDVDGGLHLT